MKKLDLHNYIESIRKSATENVFDFFKGLDPNMEPSQIKLMYYYFLSSKSMYSEMTGEAIKEYKQDLVMTKVAKEERKFMYRGQKQKLTDKIKKEYGRFRAINK